VGFPFRAPTRQLWREDAESAILGAGCSVILHVPTQRPSTVRLRTSLFQEAAEIVDREYAADLSLDDIARRVASSRRQLQRAYAEIGQTTFRDHLTRVRMQKAAEMLATRTLTVREVAHRVGYRQPAQFAKAFRRYQGVAPSDFRAGASARSGAAAPQLGPRPDGLRPAYRAA
jgi:AraC family transcriptional regulator of adaptative response / methylphosphotriester-DNA alkyltransferase methyltransferase